MKLWDKGQPTNKLIESFTIGKDKEMDIYLAPFDVLGTLAHIQMLESIKLLSAEEYKLLRNELISIYHDIVKKDDAFTLGDGVEDIHSQIEFILTEQLGDIGKKVHSGRSRNDQVLVDIKLFLRNQLQEVIKSTSALSTSLIKQSEKYKAILIPGYTHLQVAMPSSFGLWFGAFAESLTDDLLVLESAYRIANQNPLGSAAGYGSSFPLNRQMTTDLLGFDNLNYNVVYAQMGRGKTERIVSFALATVASTLAKMAMDVTLFTNQNFAFISLPDEFTTGSSIMPHKKNPDVFELIRAKCNKLQALPYELTLITTNLPSGYHRDMQILKENLFPAFNELQCIIQLVELVIDKIKINHNIINDEKYKLIFSVEEVDKLVLQGVPFRDAYVQVGKAIADGTFTTNKQVKHTHEGSIGNLCNDKIQAKADTIIKRLDFVKVEIAIGKLVN